MEQDILTPLKRYFRLNKRLPSYSEMLHIFGVASKRTIYKYVQELIDDGFLKKLNGKISPTKQFFGTPLLGNIQAGYPLLAEQNKSYLTLDDYFIEKPDNSFLLRVNGDSMINAGIFDGDLVVVEQKGSWGAEDVVLAEIDNEWTLKILKKVNGKAHLEAANPAYPPFYPRQELKIHGVVRAVLRKMNGRVN